MLAVACYPFHKLWNWKFTPHMYLIFQNKTRQLFRPFGHSSVVSSTFFFGVLCTFPVPIFQQAVQSTPTVASDSDGSSAFRVGL